MSNIPTLCIPFNNVPIIEGDTIDGLLFEFVDEENIDLTGASIKMQVFKRKTPFIDISVGNGITIIDSKSFTIDKVEKENNDYPVGTFFGDVEVTFSNGYRRTFFRVQYKIQKQYTI